MSVALLKAQNNVIKINVLSPIASTLNMQYEYAVSSKSSIQVGLFYTWHDPGTVRLTRFGITPEYRFYLSETEAPRGVFIAPFLRYVSTVREDDSADGSGEMKSFGGGIVIGRQWIFKRKIVLDMFLGPAYYAVSNNTEFDDSYGLPALFAFGHTELFKGFELRAGVCLGFNF